MTDTGTPTPAPASTARRSSWFWRVLAALMLLSVAWMLWLMWQITPRSLVTDLALRRANVVRTAPAPAAPRPEMAAETPKSETPAGLQQGDPVGLKLSTELKPAAESAPAGPRPAK